MNAVVPERTPASAVFTRFVGAIVHHQWIVLLIATLVLGVYTGWMNERFLATANLVNILEQIAVLGLVAAGATVLIISGNFDISVGAMIGLAASVAAMLIGSGVPELVASLAAIALCIACSVLNGFLSILFRAPSFIITLASLGVYHGLALALTKGVIQTIYGQYETIAETRLFGMLPLLFAISLAGYLIVHIVLSYTQIGRRCYAIGNNTRAAYLAGIRVRSNILLFFAINGVLVGLASLCLLSRIGSALPSTGEGLELLAIGAVVIGGVPITGGRGSVIGTFFGVLLIGVISNSLNMLRVNPYYQEMAFGTLIILALGIAALRYRWQQVH